MKRFYKDVAVISGGAGHEIQLDGRPVRTPARAALALPTARLAEAVADEWRRQGDIVDPGSPTVRSIKSRPIARASLRASPIMRQAISSAIAPKDRRNWFRGKRRPGTRCWIGRGSVMTSLSG
jgi:chaperone required for assembly of F1-ATPase